MITPALPPGVALLEPLAVVGVDSTPVMALPVTGSVTLRQSLWPVLDVPGAPGGALGTGVEHAAMPPVHVTVGLAAAEASA